MTAVRILAGRSSDQAEPRVSITLGSRSAALDPELLLAVEHASWVELIYDGASCFQGRPSDLAGLSFDAPSLAGEDPIERSIRLLIAASASGRAGTGHLWLEDGSESPVPFKYSD